MASMCVLCDKQNLPKNAPKNVPASVPKEFDEAHLNRPLDMQGRMKIPSLHCIFLVLPWW